MRVLGLAFLISGMSFSFLPSALGSSAEEDYQQALELARYRSAGEVCQHDAYAGRILDLLERALLKDSELLFSMMFQAEFYTLRPYIRYQLLEMADVESEGGLREVLSQSTFYGPHQGVFGHMVRLRLLKNGKVLRGRLVFDPDGAVVPEWRYSTEGAWKVEGKDVHLIGVGAVEAIETFTLDKDTGDLKHSTKSEVRYYNLPLECSA